MFPIVIVDGTTWLSAATSKAVGMPSIVILVEFEGAPMQLKRIANNVDPSGSVVVPPVSSFHAIVSVPLLLMPALYMLELNGTPNCSRPTYAATDEFQCSENWKPTMLLKPVTRMGTTTSFPGYEFVEPIARVTVFGDGVRSPPTGSLVLGARIVRPPL